MRLARLDELHVIGQEIYAQFLQAESKEAKKQVLIDSVYDLLVLAYIYGEQRVKNVASEFVPEDEIQTDPQRLYEALYKRVAGENFEERLSRRVDEETLDIDTLQRIIDTDYHRMEETGAYDTAEIVEERTGRTAYKVWETMQYDRVRPTHWYLQSKAVPMSARFYTYDGDSARYPGDFEKAENNSNCRCEISFTFR